MSQPPMTCFVEALPLDGMGFEALSAAGTAASTFVLQRSQEGGAPAEFSYYGLDVEPIKQEHADALTTGGTSVHYASDRVAAAAGAIPFKGGVFVYLPYDTVDGQGHAFWLTRVLLILVHRTSEAFVASLSREATSGAAVAWAARLQALVANPPASSEDTQWQVDVTFEAYCAGIQAVQARIAAGEIEQAIYSLSLSKRTPAQAEGVFHVLQRRNASPHVFLVRHGEATLIGASPAMHLRKAGELLTVETDAGTRRLGVTEQETKAIERELLSAEKDLEEQRMIVDETIADLAAIASGPVEVPVRLEVRRLGSVMHLFTVLQARVAPGVTPLGAVTSCFPPAAVTGVPRRAAMAVIREVEKVARGPYGGVLGVVSLDGSVDTAIILRSAVLRDGSVVMRCGGGITHASVAADEYQECLNKARSLQSAIDEAEAALRTAPV